MGGIIIGYEIGKILSVDTIFAERVNNIFELRRDFKIKDNSNVLIMEDVITTGKSSLECSKIVTSSTANLIGYGCIIDRSNGLSSLKKDIISQLEINIPTYTHENIPEELSKIKAVKPGSRGL